MNKGMIFLIQRLIVVMMLNLLPVKSVEMINGDMRESICMTLGWGGIYKNGTDGLNNSSLCHDDSTLGS